MMPAWMMHISDACVYDAHTYDACIYNHRYLTLMRVCMMHISMILDPDACMHDAYIYDPWSECLCVWLTYVWCMYLWSSILDPDACMYDAYLWSLILMHVRMMHISMILDPDACVYDEHMYDPWIYDHQYLTLMHVCVMHVKNGDGRTYGKLNSRSRMHRLPQTLVQAVKSGGELVALPHCDQWHRLSSALSPSQLTPLLCRE